MDQPNLPLREFGASRESAPPIALSEFFDGHPVATFVINKEHTVTHWNKACADLLGWPAMSIIGTRRHAEAFYADGRPMLCDLILDENAAALAKYTRSALIDGAFEREEFFENLGLAGHWLHFTAAPLRDHSGAIVGAIETMRDVTERRAAENALRAANDNLEDLVARRTAQLGEVNRQLEADIRQRAVVDAERQQRTRELMEVNAKLSMAQEQLVQSEKMASIGQLAAGVAHEINNPIGYIFSNINVLRGYLDQLFAMLAAYRAAEAALPPEVALGIASKRGECDVDFLQEDVPVLMRETLEGIARVRAIVQDLKDFSRLDSGQEWSYTNLHTGIDSTLNIVANETKYKAELVKEYGNLPDIECLPSQINQVILNLVVNAAHAMETSRGRIVVRTGCVDDNTVWIEVEDNGSGIAREHLGRIFDPFFTTKPVGKGTGLGLSLSYGIVQKHRGTISVESEPGRGTTFRITLPVHHHTDTEADPA